MNQRNRFALGILNNVIFALYFAGFGLAATVIEKMRDREARDLMNKKEEARKNRAHIYNKVDQLMATANRFNKTKSMMDEVGTLCMLSKVYCCAVANLQKLKTFEKSSDLYDALSYSYLYSFEQWVDGQPLYKSGLSDLRNKFDNVGRAIRHIKEDHPHFFNCELIKKAAGDEMEAIETHGNSQDTL